LELVNKFDIVFFSDNGNSAVNFILSINSLAIITKLIEVFRVFSSSIPPGGSSVHTPITQVGTENGYRACAEPNIHYNGIGDIAFWLESNAQTFGLGCETSFFINITPPFPHPPVPPLRVPSSSSNSQATRIHLPKARTLGLRRAE